MGLAHSPSIVTDGLVFAYDMGNTRKSFKGTPTINRFTLPEVDVNGFGVQNSTFTRVRTGNFAGYDILPTDYVWRYNVSGNDCPYHGWDISTTIGSVVTFSFDYYIDPSTANYPITNYLANFENAGSGVGGSVGDPTPSITGVWKTAYMTSTAAATGLSRCLLYPGACGGRLGDAGFILYRNPQVEFNTPGGLPTPFVAGTRFFNNNLETTPSYPTWNSSGNGSSASGGTLTFVNGSYNSKGVWDLYKTYSGLSTATNYTWSARVRLGTATNFLVTMNNTAAWNTGPSAQFYAGQLSTLEFTRVSITGTTNTGSFNLHLGASNNSELAAIVQTGGTVSIEDVRLELTGSQTALVDLMGNNTVAANSLTYASDGTFSFNGSSNFMTFPENSALNTQTPTVEVWVKTNATTQNGFWFEKGNVNTQYSLFQEGANIQWRMIVGGGSTDLSTNTATHMNTLSWYQVVATYTSGDRRLYINGVLVNSDTQTGTLTTNTNGCSIGVYGGFNGARGYYYNGNIALVKIYNRALTAAEVQQNFNALRGRYGI